MPAVVTVLYHGVRNFEVGVQSYGSNPLQDEPQNFVHVCRHTRRVLQTSVLQDCPQLVSMKVEHVCCRQRGVHLRGHKIEDLFEQGSRVAYSKRCMTPDSPQCHQDAVQVTAHVVVGWEPWERCTVVQQCVHEDVIHVDGTIWQGLERNTHVAAPCSLLGRYLRRDLSGVLVCMQGESVIFLHVCKCNVRSSARSCFLSQP